MAKLSSYRTIYKQDFDPKYSDLVDSLSLTINDSFNEIYGALKNNITFSDNINATISTITVSVDSTGKVQKSTSFKTGTYQTSVKGLMVINAACTSSNFTFPNSGLFVDYVFNSGVVNLNYIKGLPANETFSLTILVI
jgi:hypothetical protein